MASEKHRVWLQVEPHPLVYDILDGRAEIIGPLVRPDKDDLLTEIEIADAVLAGTEFPANRETFLRSPRLKAVCRFGIGYDSVDVEAATDPGKRYKMAGNQGGDPRGYRAAFSADGLRWYPYEKEIILPAGDTLTLTQHPQTGEYLAYHKQHTEIRGFRRRLIYLSRSLDFQEWTEPELVLAPDEIDDLWAAGPDQRTEFYIMSVFPSGGPWYDPKTSVTDRLKT